MCVSVSKQMRLLWRWPQTTTTPRERWFSASHYENTTRPGNWLHWWGLMLRNLAGNFAFAQYSKGAANSDASVACTTGMRCRAFLMRCAWWTSWTRAIRLIWPWWSARTWEWRWPSCTAGLWHTTASVCSWMQTPWWENTEQMFLFDSLESQNFFLSICQ